MTANLTAIRAQSNNVDDALRHANEHRRAHHSELDRVKPGPAHRACQRGDEVMGMLDVQAFRAGSVLGFMRVVGGLAWMRRVLLLAVLALAVLPARSASRSTHGS